MSSWDVFPYVFLRCSVLSFCHQDVFHQKEMSSSFIPCFVASRIHQCTKLHSATRKGYESVGLIIPYRSCLEKKYIQISVIASEILMINNMHKAKNVQQVTLHFFFLHIISKNLRYVNHLTTRKISNEMLKSNYVRNRIQKEKIRVHWIILIYCHKRCKANKWEDTIFMLKCAINMTEHHKKCSDIIHLKLVQINILLVEKV